ncbi:MAG: oligosaccharide flippase family protein [Lachnospiraceae bacterium]|nr:oligosaccharide flippase family protein [Lachnospiraceae bacterium]
MTDSKSDNLGINKKSFIWNIIGSVLGAISSFVLLLCVTRTVGATEGGIFSLAFATAQILLTLGKFGVRSYQATDINDEIELGTYLVTRIWFCILMLFIGVLYVLIAGYDMRKSLIFIFVCIIKMVDAIEDVFHGQLQKIGHLDVAGKLLALRNMITILCFAIALYGTRNLLFGCIITAGISVVIGLFGNIAVTKQYMSVQLTVNHQHEKKLILACLPLFIGSFLSIYIYNVPKYALDFMGTESEIAVYSIIFMPAFVINLFSEFVFKPLLTMIASYWNNHQMEKFISVVVKLMINIMVITIIVMLGAYLIGAQLLSVFYAVDVVTYRRELVILMLSGGFSAAVYLLYNVLTSMRAQKIIIANYAIVAVLITIIAAVGVYNWKITGGAVAYLISEIILFGLMLIGTLVGYWKECSRNEDRNCNISGNE